MPMTKRLVGRTLREAIVDPKTGEGSPRRAM